jgi:DNA-binding NarL/FixJ family response regulator
MPLPYRVLVVEDHETWRRHLCSVIGETRQWEAIGTASHGFEAIQKAEALKPDLILLDIGLPDLDGLEVAQRIITDNPGSKILFVSEHQSADVVGAALGTGARGYINKSEAGRELLPAMSAIVQGSWFVGAKFGGRFFDEATDTAAARELRRHEAGLYPDEASLLDDCARFAQSALRSGTSLIAVSPESRREPVERRLRTRGIDVGRALRAGKYRVLEVPATLSTFVVDGRLDEARFWKMASAVVVEAAQATGGHRGRVALYSDCAATLLRNGMVEVAISLEQVADELARTFDLDVFCPYLVGDLHCEDDDNPVFQTICAAHSEVRPRTR